MKTAKLQSASKKSTTTLNERYEALRAISALRLPEYQLNPLLSTILQPVPKINSSYNTASQLVLKLCIDVMKFSKKDSRAALHYPWIKDGNLYCTDGKLMIRLKNINSDLYKDGYYDIVKNDKKLELKPIEHDYTAPNGDTVIPSDIGYSDILNYTSAIETGMFLESKGIVDTCHIKDNKEQEYIVNYKYMNSIAKTLGKTVNVHVKNPKEPLVFSAKMSNLTIVLMPIFVK